MSRRLCILLLALLLAGSADTADAQSDTTHARAPGTAEFQLSDRLIDLDLGETPDGLRYRFTDPQGRRVELTPGQFAQALHDKQNRRGTDRPLLHILFDITSWTGVLWVGLGLLGQALFTGRMLVQWLSSERAKRSVVPPAFWWLSLIGAAMLLAYFIWRTDIVGVLGQSAGFLIYARNLWLIYTTNDPDSRRPTDAGPTTS
ncbi:lipid-A-disaccharide synthase N-terminal domain-containing protein [Phycisphaeraceae bacterium D3-23]